MAIPQVADEVCHPDGVGHLGEFDSDAIFQNYLHPLSFVCCDWQEVTIVDCLDADLAVVGSQAFVPVVELVNCNAVLSAKFCLGNSGFFKLPIN